LPTVRNCGEREDEEEGRAGRRPARAAAVRTRLARPPDVCAHTHAPTHRNACRVGAHAGRAAGPVRTLAGLAARRSLCAPAGPAAHPADSNSSACAVEMSAVGKSQDTAWKDVLDTKGLSAAAPILEEYGLSCESDMSRVDEEDLVVLCSKLIIAWEIGMIAGIMQQGYAPSEKADLSKASVRGGKALTESQYSFQLEPYENGAPAPTMLQPEVPVAVADASPFLLTDFSKMDVVKASAHTIVAPAIDYWIKTIDIKKGDEVARFKAAHTFNSLHVVVNKISVADIDNLNLFKLSDHPQIKPHIEGMKSEINKYHAIVQSIKFLDERKDAKGQDTFWLPEWWRCNSGALPHLSLVLRALLTNAPNSCPPERLFSMFNATFGEDQRRAFGDYLELAMQSQYNKRNL
jgi:hypothetical protein